MCRYILFSVKLAFVFLFSSKSSDAMMRRSLHKLRALTASPNHLLRTEMPTRMASAEQQKALFSTKWPAKTNSSKISATNSLSNEHGQQHNSLTAAELRLSDKFENKCHGLVEQEKLSSSKAIATDLPYIQKMGKFQIKKRNDEAFDSHGNEPNSASILVLSSKSDFSNDEAIEEFVQFVTNGRQIVSEIRGEKDVKYANDFFDKLIKAVLQAEPAMLPKMTFLTAPHNWTKNVFSFVEEFDGATCRIKLGDANFEYAAEQYNQMPQNNENLDNLNAYKEFLMKREGTDGQFVFRFYYKNLDKNDSARYEEKYVAIEIFSRK